jgi:hypothetical protein
MNPEYAKWWQQQLQLQAAAKQATWQQLRALSPGTMGQWALPWQIAPPGVNAPMPNPLLSRASVPSLAEADPGNAMAGFFMGNPDVGNNPLLMHALLGSEPGLANV